MDIDEAMQIMHPVFAKGMQHHNACTFGKPIPRVDCRQCELLDIIDDLTKLAKSMSIKCERLARVYAHGL